MRAFIIRPFRVQREIDFDAVEKELIGPALSALGIEGRTTIEILRQGNIRVDMFQRLLTADLVVADLSIHNANVFYELGVRHALRSKYTFLLRANIDKYPFDLQTDRYFIYEKDLPAASLAALIAALRHTLASDASTSPVFQLLPNLKEQERSRFCAGPRGFQETVGQAEAGKRVGDLSFLAAEIQDLEWECEGLRAIGRAQFHLKAFSEARAMWEAVRSFDVLDLEKRILCSSRSINALAIWCVPTKPCSGCSTAATPRVNNALRCMRCVGAMRSPVGRANGGKSASGPAPPRSAAVTVSGEFVRSV